MASPPLYPLAISLVLAGLLHLSILAPGSPTLGEAVDPPANSSSTGVGANESVSRGVPPNFTAGGKLVELKPPVVVIGAELRIGTLIIIALAERQERVIAVSREATTPDSMIIKLAYGVHYVHGNLNHPATYARYFKGAKAVIFASQARSVFDQDRESIRFTNGDTPKNVEFRGVRSAARAAIMAKVPNFILVSMYLVTRTSSNEYKFINKFKRAMYWKRRAELDLIRHCRASDSITKYTIVRAGGSTGEKGFGLEKVVIRQGDYLRGSLPLEDLASVTVASLFTNTTKNTVFECVTGEEGSALGFERLEQGNDGSPIDCPDEDRSLVAEQ
ncbi:hypothetical protein AAMO2058_000215900 [Amorphochlora amoebiformis]